MHVCSCPAADRLTQGVVRSAHLDVRGRPRATHIQQEYGGLQCDAASDLLVSKALSIRVQQ
jgi:hypothetical protein